MKPRAEVADHAARLLIADDEQHDRRQLEVMLGAARQAAHRSERDEALTIVTEQLPGLVLPDVMAPGMNGLTLPAVHRLHRQVRRKTSSRPSNWGGSGHPGRGVDPLATLTEALHQ